MHRHPFPCLLAVPHLDRLLSLDLLLELENTVEKGLSSRRTARDVDVNGDNAIASTDDSVRVVVVAAAVGTRSHRDNPAGLRLESGFGLKSAPSINERCTI